MIKFHCGHCYKKMGMPDPFATRLVKCPRCGEPNRVPEETPADVDDPIFSWEALEEVIDGVVHPAPAVEKLKAMGMWPPPQHKTALATATPANTSPRPAPPAAPSDADTLHLKEDDEDLPVLELADDEVAG